MFGFLLQLCVKECMMNGHVIFNGVDNADRVRLEKYWATKLPRLQTLLAPYPAHLRDIRLTIYHQPHNGKHSWYEARAVVQLPTGTLVAKAYDHNPLVVLDRVADDLASAIKRHKELVRKDYIFKRKARQRGDLSTVEPLLERDVEMGRREDFVELLRPLLGFLRNYARRELHILEQKGVLHRREASVDDALDEVLTRAWQRFADRPRNQPLHLWLTHLLHETLNQWAKQEPRPHLSLEAKAEEVLPNEEPPKEQEEEWWAEPMGYNETFALEDLIPSSDGNEILDQPEAEELRNRLSSLVAQLPAVQRQAFLLHALEDYDPAEIAMLQDRPESQVRADIKAARHFLRDRLRAEDAGQKSEAGSP